MSVSGSSFQAAPGATPDWRRLAFFTWVGLALLRWLMLWIVPLDLAGDEAYYWEWGRRPDWGYFSKPPGIGWIMALSVQGGFDSALGLRTLSVLFGAGTLGGIYFLAERLYGARAGFLAMLFFAANPANAALNALLTIDAPFVFFWVAALWTFWRFREGGFRSVPWGALFVVAMAGGLLSKQMMLVLYLTFLLALGLSGAECRLLRAPGLWLGLLIPLLALVPPLVWNARNGWPTFHHTLHHFEAASPALLSRLWRVVEFVVVQMALVTPISWCLIAAALFCALASWRRIGSAERFLVLCSAPGLMVMGILALRQKMNPNWPAAFYPAATILLAGWVVQAWSTGRPIEQFRQRWLAGLKLGVALLALTYVALFLATHTGFLPAWVDPSARLRGWSQLAADVQKVRSALPEPRPPILITQGHRFVTSQLAFYLPDRPILHPYRERLGVVENQYDFWPPPRTDLGVDALIIVQGPRERLPEGLRDNFDRVVHLADLEYPRQKSDFRRFSIYHGIRLQRWP